MLSIEDCIAFSDLSEDEILAIAEHEHISEMAALEMGNYLVHTSSGEKRIKAMISDDIKVARTAGNVEHVATLKLVLKNFVAHHACKEQGVVH